MVGQSYNLEKKFKDSAKKKIFHKCIRSRPLYNLYNASEPSEEQNRNQRKQQLLCRVTQIMNWLKSFFI